MYMHRIQGDASLHDLRHWDGVDDVVDAVRMPAVNESPVRHEPTDAEVMLSGDDSTVVDVPATAICYKPAIESVNLKSCEPAETRKSQRIRKAPVRFRGASPTVLVSEVETESAAESGDMNAQSVVILPYADLPRAKETTLIPALQETQNETISSHNQNTVASAEPVVGASAQPLLPFSENAVWGELRGSRLSEKVNEVILEVTKWKRNIFYLPT